MKKKNHQKLSNEIAQTLENKVRYITACYCLSNELMKKCQICYLGIPSSVDNVLLIVCYYILFHLRKLTFVL